MPESLTSKLVPEPENKCPYCLYMKLEGHLTQQEKPFILLPFRPKQTETEQMSLHLFINFGKQKEFLPFGSIKFGLNGGQLKLKLKSGKMPFEDRKLTNPLPISVQKERQKQESSKSKADLKPSFSDGKAKVEVNLGTEQAENRTDKFQFTDHQISTTGPENNPIWEFKVETGEPFLEGQFGKAELGTLTVTGKPCCVEATFEVSQRDVELIEAEGVYGKDIIREKRTTVDILLVKSLLKSKLMPYVSRVELQYV